MSYIIMAEMEEGSETRVSDFDQHDRGFDGADAAYDALYRIENEERYPEFRRMWVEELRDMEYWLDHLDCYSDA